jgi:hypothetical protein
MRGVAPAPHGTTLSMIKTHLLQKKCSSPKREGNKAPKVGTAGVYGKCLPNSGVYKVLTFSVGFE